MGPITIMDRLTSASAAMASALYVVASLFLWSLLAIRLFTGKGPPQAMGHKNVVLDRACAWAALAALFGGIALGKAKLVGWQQLDIVFLIGTAVVTVTGLISVREITRQKFSSRILDLFLVVLFAVGVTVWFSI
jgi:hypothetical protein